MQPKSEPSSARSCPSEVQGRTFEFDLQQTKKHDTKFGARRTYALSENKVLIKSYLKLLAKKIDSKPLYCISHRLTSNSLNFFMRS